MKKTRIQELEKEIDLDFAACVEKIENEAKRQGSAEQKLKRQKAGKVLMNKQVNR